MKTKINYAIAIAVLLVSSCDDSLDVSNPQDFNVTTEKNTYMVGEEITFSFTGNPSMITFYSGEKGNDYAYREQRVVPKGSSTLSFNSRMTQGTQQDQLTVLVSSNYNGMRNIEAIKGATWTDITSRFTLANTDGTTYVESGVVDVTDLVHDNRLLYVAFQYVNDPVKGSASTWNINNLALTNTTEVGTTVLANHTTAGFGLFYVGPKETTGRSSIASGLITLQGNTEENIDAYTEDWCVSKGFSLADNDLGPDRPVKVKGNSDAAPESFLHMYNDPGTYKVYFVATNATVKEQETIIREITLEITQ